MVQIYIWLSQEAALASLRDREGVESGRPTALIQLPQRSGRFGDLAGGSNLFSDLGVLLLVCAHKDMQLFLKIPPKDRSSKVEPANAPY